jgi:hypothetical protein
MVFPVGRDMLTGKWTDNIRPIEWIEDLFAQHMDWFDSLPRKIRDQINETGGEYGIVLGVSTRRGQFTWRKPPASPARLARQARPDRRRGRR